MKIKEKVVQKMHEQIQRSQTRELERFLTDRAYAERKGKDGLHACLLKYLPPGEGGRVLELGCGPGKYVGLLATAGYSVIGVDPLEFPSWERLRQHPEVNLRSGVFAESLPYDDSSFDHVVCIGALLYFSDPRLAIEEICRVLKPGGKLLIRNVNKGNWYTSHTGRALDPASSNLYTMQELQSLLSSGQLTPLESFSYGFWPPVLTNMFWYLTCVWFPDGFTQALARTLPEEKRLNLVICLRKDTASP